MATSYFNPLRRLNQPHLSIVINTDMPRGYGVMRDPVGDGTTGIAATGSVLGFLFREVATQTDDEKFLARTQAIAGGNAEAQELEGPDEPGGACTLEKLAKFECEGPDYIATGTGALDGTEAVGQVISWNDGKIRKKQGSDTDQGWRIAEVKAALDAENAALFVIENINA
jgi:hypothetical protein